MAEEMFHNEMQSIRKKYRALLAAHFEEIHDKQDEPRVTHHHSHEMVSSETKHGKVISHQKENNLGKTVTMHKWYNHDGAVINKEGEANMPHL